jgi:hypothetical protein
MFEFAPAAGQQRLARLATLVRLALAWAALAIPLLIPPANVVMTLFLIENRFNMILSSLIELVLLGCQPKTTFRVSLLARILPKIVRS